MPAPQVTVEAVPRSQVMQAMVQSTANNVVAAHTARALGGPGTPKDQTRCRNLQQGAFQNKTNKVGREGTHLMLGDAELLQHDPAMGLDKLFVPSRAASGAPRVTKALQQMLYCPQCAVGGSLWCVKVSSGGFVCDTCCEGYSQGKGGMIEEGGYWRCSVCPKPSSIELDMPPWLDAFMLKPLRKLAGALGLGLDADYEKNGVATLQPDYPVLVKRGDATVAVACVEVDKNAGRRWRTTGG